MNISHLKSSNSKAFTGLIVPFLIAIGGIYLSLLDSYWLYISGQILLSIFFLQTFILLHECGHFNFFRSKLLNQIFGHIFGILSLIPFYTWRHIHYQHHIWTGWRDKDPTTEKTVEPSNSRVLRFVTNISWKFFIPIFFLGYMLSNYWNVFKIKRFLDVKKYHSAILQISIYLIIYLVVIVFFGNFILIFLLPAFVLSLIWKELVILTQHSHIEIPISEGNEVHPVAFKDQIKYTRSFYLNSTLSHYILFNFNLHEAHHAYPVLPAYWLKDIELGIERKPLYCDWFKQAKSMKVEDYVFRTSKHTGLKF